MKLRELGERKAIDKIWQDLGKSIEHDDCSYIPRGEEYILFTTDYVGEDTHFVRDANPRVIGEFIAGVNLSDIAAMGGLGDHFLLSAFMPGDVDYGFLRDVIIGINTVLDRYNVKYLGGDLKESRITGFSGFAVGHVERDRIMKRSGARIGDIIAITGPLGKNAASYYLWSMGLMPFDEVIKITPRIEEGRELSGVATSAMDTSDGLIGSLAQMQLVSGLGFRVDFESLPVHPLAMEVVEDYDISLFDLLTFGGEYEIIYTAERRILGYEIGEVVEEKIDYGGLGYESFG